MLHTLYAIKKIIGICVLFLGVGYTLGFDIPAYDGYVTDTADVLTVEQEQELENQMYALWQKTNTEIGVLIIPSLEDNDIAMLAVDVGNKRGVGDKKYDNGILILIAIDDRSWFNAIGYGLEGTLPDAIARRIGEDKYVANFQAEKYFEGLSAGISDMENYILQDPTTLSYYQDSNNPGSSDDLQNKLLAIYFFLSLIFGRLITEKDTFVVNRSRKMISAALAYGGVFGAIGGLITGAWALSFAAAYGILLGAMIMGFLKITWLFFGFGGGGGGGGGSSFGGFGGGSFGGGGGGGRR